MTKHFHALNTEKQKDGKVFAKGLMLVEAVVTLDPDDKEPGGGGGGGGRIPDIKIELRERDDVKWIYSDGTPAWAIAAAEAVGYETVHIQDLPRNYPWK